MPPAGWTKLNLGVYVSPDGALHLSLRDLLEANGYEVTPENLAALVDAARAMSLDLGIELEETE